MSTQDISIKQTPDSYGCLDFRRAKLADPKRLPDAAQAHLESCALCQAFARRADKMEAAVADALSVPIPEGLAERIILRARKGQVVRPSLMNWQATNWRVFALAASVVLTIAVSITVLGLPRQGETNQLAMAVAAHAVDEPNEIRTHHSADISQFGLILANFGGAMQQPLGQVQYIHFCPIEGFGMGWHVSYKTPEGMVTLLLIPGEHKGPDTQTVQVEGKQVRVQRAGQGFYALITDNMPALEAADHDLQTKVRWKS